MTIFALFLKSLRLPLVFSEALGGALLAYVHALKWVALGRIRGRATVLQAQRVGVESLPMVLVLATIGGGVLSLQLCNTLAQSGGDAYIGGLVAIAVVREVAPIFTALALAARTGTAMASELGHMVLSNQVDALKVLHICPQRYLVLPRVLAYLWCAPFLAVVAAAVAIISGMCLARWVVGMNYAYFLHSIFTMLPVKDIVQLLVKSMAFAAVLGATCSYVGMNVRGGAREVGLAATKTAVWVSVLVLVVDLGITWLFKTLPIT